MTKEEKRAYDAARYAAHKAEIVAEKHAYRKANVEKIAAAKRAYYLARKTEITAHMRVYYKANQETVVAKVREYRKANRDKVVAGGLMYRKAHRAELAARTRSWAKDNPDKVADRSARRRAMKRHVTVEKVSRAVVYERDGGRCHLCGKKVPKNRWHLDHLIPLARGGEHSYRNVAVACPCCNMTKHTKGGSQLRLI